MDIVEVENNSFVTEKKVGKLSDKERKEELILELLKTKEDLLNANRNFEYAEEELIDFYSYEIKAYRVKFDHLIRKAKEINVESDLIEKCKIISKNKEAV